MPGTDQPLFCVPDNILLAFPASSSGQELRDRLDHFEDYRKVIKFRSQNNIFHNHKLPH